MRLLISLVLSALLSFIIIGCFKHRYKVKTIDNGKFTENTNMYFFALAGWVPQKEIMAEELCPQGKVQEIIMYDSALDGLICGATLLLVCPHTVGVKCYD